jgi:O-methyltransferase
MDGTISRCCDRTESVARSVFNKAREALSSRMSPEGRKTLDRRLMYLNPPRFPGISLKDRLDYVRRQNVISQSVNCPHQDVHIVAFIEDFLSITSDVDGCVVEAGCYKGGGTAKFSIGAKAAGRRLVIFDSFQGIPPNDEEHDTTIYGEDLTGAFAGGTFAGTLDEVRSNVGKYGEIDVCEFVEGWFEDTLPGFAEPIAAAYIDADLASSTRTCLKYIYPLMVPGGILHSHDGNMPLVVDVFDDDAFWKTELGCRKPQIEGLGTDKILKIRKT